MKNITAKNFWRAFGLMHSRTRLGAAIILVALVFGAFNLASASTVSWVSGGVRPGFSTGAGYADGVTDGEAEYHTPSGVAMDSSGTYLFVADRDNNLIRYLDLSADQTWTFAIVQTNLVNKPIGVAVDSSLDVFVLNQGKGTNGTVVEFDNFGETIATNTSGLTNAGGIALDTAGNIYVTASNTLFRISGTTKTTIATITNAGASLQGLVVKHNGLIAACDSGRNGIYLIDPSTGAVTTNAGFHGVGDFTTNGNNIASSSTAKFNQPMSVVEAGDGTLIVSDYGNNRVKVVLTSGLVTNLYGITSQYWSGTYKGFSGGTSGTDNGLAEIPKAPDSQVPNASARLPFGIAFAPDGSVYVTEDYYHIIRHVSGAGLQAPPPPAPAAPTGLTVTTNFGQVILTWTASFNATNYNVQRATSSGGPYTIIGTTTSTSFTDTNVINGTTYYYVVSAVNSGGEGPNSLEVSATPPIPPPSVPIIGWFDYEGNNQTGFFTVLHSVSIATFNNDTLIAINPTVNGISTYYIAGPAPLSTLPSSTNGSTPPFYQDGLGFAQPLVLTTVPDLVIKAVNVGPGGSSPVVTAEFIFQVANPTITGNNAAQFMVSDQTTNAVFWYTTDGSMPSNGAPSIGPITNNPATISLNISSNTVFTVRAFRNGYQPSGPAIQLFSPTNFVPNTISFGFASGEASSDFVASPGQIFYAPVTLSVLSSAVMYSLQFNLTVTNAGPNPGPPITSGAFDFASMLEKPLPGSTPVTYVKIPPYMFIGDATGPIPPGQIVSYDGTNFVNLELANTNINLLAVGWLERAGVGETNLYDTTSQDLIQFSQAHDTLFLQANGQIVVGGYAFQVPANALPGQTYQIQIGRPSATSDGIGAPGGSVFIAAPTNGSLVGGALNSIKVVTAGQRKYIAGDAYPFRWLNAGDFGNTNLENADVEQVFQSAVYNWNDPAPGSDFFDSMDSCGNTYVDNGHGYLENSGTAANTFLLFDGNDTTINQIAFGDGTLDVCDVYVTYRRSLDPSLVWFRRFWTNDIVNGFSGRAAEITSNAFNPNVVFNSSPVVNKSKGQTANVSSGASQPKVNFSATDFVASAGQVVNIPITAQIFGSYPLRVLMLNLSVVPLDGSPALTTPVQFTANSVLGQPYSIDSTGNGNYAAVWLNNTNAGLTGSAVIGTLTVTIPPTATANSAYDIHFDHASASPNGIASFPKQTLTGLVTLSSRTNSSYGDGIPDSWRLRWFGTVNNSLSVSNADACGDGINNWSKFIAGTDPTDPKAYPHLNAATPVPSGSTAAMHWPTVNGKKYVILRSSSLFSGSWSAITTNTGTGTDMEFDDSTSGKTQFYRVQILP